MAIIYIYIHTYIYEKTLMSDFNPKTSIRNARTGLCHNRFRSHQFLIKDYSFASKLIGKAKIFVNGI
jgi:hypothetical protein